MLHRAPRAAPSLGQHPPQAPGPDQPAAKIWLPRDGKVLARFPGGGWGHHWTWLTHTMKISQPRINERGYWELPRNSATRLVRASVDRFGLADVYRDMARLSRCNVHCLQASGVDCQCSCLGEHHGENNMMLWFSRFGDVLVADLGGYIRVHVQYAASPADPETGLCIYAGELNGRQYTIDLNERAAWPPVSRFICTACITSRARVWDHCHAHGFVRGPLCNRCNTRNWHEWAPEYGRTGPEENIDTSYYGNCPGHARNSPLLATLPCSP